MYFSIVVSSWTVGRGLKPPPSATAETLTYPQTVTPSLTLLNLTLDLIYVAPCSHAVRNRTEQKFMMRYLSKSVISYCLNANSGR